MRAGRTKNSSVLARQWQILLAIQGSRSGITVARLVRETGVSRSTVYRYLDFLEQVGVPLHATPVNGETRYRFMRPAELPPLGFSALQIAALHLARRELEPLAGTALVRELDELLQKLRPIEPQESFRFTERPVRRPQILRTVEQALHHRRRARIEYRAASRKGGTTFVHIEPLLLNVADGEPYVRAYCVERQAERTYKLVRIAAAALTEEPFSYSPPRPPAEAFSNAVKAWSGDSVRVRVRLAPDVAWRAGEYPLVPNQEIERASDGSAVVRAKVSGLVEASRWVLSWGDAAEALEPVEVRTMLRAELQRALAKYDNGPAPVKAPDARSYVPRTTRLTQGGNGRS